MRSPLLTLLAAAALAGCVRSPRPLVGEQALPLAPGSITTSGSRTLVAPEAGLRPPEWIWTSAAAPDQETALFLRRFELPGSVMGARLRATADDRMRVLVNGVQLAAGDQWWWPLELDATPLLRAGSNEVAVLARNTGGPGGVWVELAVEGEERRLLRLISDASWSCVRLPDGDFDTWTPEDLDLAQATAPHVLGPVGIEPWQSAGPRMRGDGASPSEAAIARALDAEELLLPPGFRAELLHSVSKEEQGSWVAMCASPAGGLFVSDQHGALYHVTPPPVGAPAERKRIERLPIDIGRAHGLCWAFDALYVVVAEPGGRETGLHRCRDTDGDGALDTIELLRAFDGSGEHGPHAVVLGPDQRLWIIAGNHTALPEPLAHSRVPPLWDEDVLLPRVPDPNGHAVGILAPGGWVARTDADGASFELWAAGMRNAYDLAFDERGEPFTFDSDMEWDVGLPWYRPTRIVHLASGADFGWRNGSGKWPMDLPDTLPSVCDLGISSPTGVAFGYPSAFPEPYRSALFASDWAYGTIHAVHLEPAGASFTGKAEPFLRGRPFPVTDLVFGADGAMYVTTGGRKTQSGLYRITWEGPEAARSTQAPQDERGREDREWRKALEGLHAPGGEQRGDLIEAALGSLDDPCPFVRNAARAGLERVDADLWARGEPRSLKASVQAALALAHQGRKDLLALAATDLERHDLARAGEADGVALLRAWQLLMLRLGPLESDVEARLRAGLERAFPSGSQRLDRELAVVLAHLQSQAAIEPMLAKLAQEGTQEEKLHYAYGLRVVREGWTQEQRRRLLDFLDGEARTFRGGNSLAKYLAIVRADAVATFSERERRELAAVLEPRATAASSGTSPPMRFVRAWTRADLEPLLAPGLKGRDLANGRRAFEAARCGECHRMAGEGGSSAPDLTGAGARFSRLDLLEAVLEPSKAFSDQYQDVEILTRQGDLHVGRVELDRGGRVALRMLPPFEELIELPAAEIASRRLHPLSRMPAGLMDVLTAEEILDLFAFVLSGGDGADPMFAAGDGR